MEFITTNQDTIVAWYNKQVVKAGHNIPELPNPDLWCDIPHSLKLKVVEHKLGRPATLIKIIPLLRRNLCHFNVCKMLQILNKKEKRYKGVLGYNVTGCPCGKIYGIELHSVLKYDDEYIDLTRDFAGATKKYFVPLFDWEFEEWGYIQSVIREFKICDADIANWGSAHSCRIPHKKVVGSWEEPEKKGDWDDIQELISFF